MPLLCVNISQIVRMRLENWRRNKLMLDSLVLLLFGPWELLVAISVVVVVVIVIIAVVDWSMKKQQQQKKRRSRNECVVINLCSYQHIDLISITLIIFWFHSVALKWILVLACVAHTNVSFISLLSPWVSLPLTPFPKSATLNLGFGSLRFRLKALRVAIRVFSLKLLKFRRS